MHFVARVLRTGLPTMDRMNNINLYHTATLRTAVQIAFGSYTGFSDNVNESMTAHSVTHEEGVTYRMLTWY